MSLSQIKYRKSSIKRPLSNKPPPFSEKKSYPPLPSPLHPYSSQTINMDWSVMVYSGWKFILLLVFGHMTSNFMRWTFSTLCSNSLWRIVTISLLLSILKKPSSHWCISQIKLAPPNPPLPPLSIKPPSKALEKNKPPGGLNRGFAVSLHELPWCDAHGVDCPSYIENKVAKF